MNGTRIFPQESSEPSSDKELFSSVLDQLINELKDIHDHLSREYNAYALEQHEARFYNIGQQFDDMAENQNNHFYRWVDRSRQSKTLVRRAATKAYDVALYFENVYERGYKRTKSKRKVNSLSTAIKNLKRQNDKR